MIFMFMIKIIFKYNNLQFELMIESVLHARDKHLKSDGAMWPSHARLYLVPVTAQPVVDERVNFWSDLYGFDFSLLKYEIIFNDV